MTTCIGFGEQERVCTNSAGPGNPIWCDACDKARKAHITKQMEGILTEFDRSPTQETEDG
jgi:hypothetical protein